MFRQWPSALASTPFAKMGGSGLLLKCVTGTTAGLSMALIQAFLLEKGQEMTIKGRLRTRCAWQCVTCLC